MARLPALLAPIEGAKVPFEGRSLRVGPLDRFDRWSLAVIAGGGVAGVIQASSVLARGLSTASTGGVGNPLVSTGELFSSVLGTVISIVLPLLAVALVVLLLVLILRRFFRKKPGPA